jgi:hypothetical protein
MTSDAIAEPLAAMTAFRRMLEPWPNVAIEK